MADEELVCLCRENDKDAWHELCTRYSCVSRAIASKYCFDSSETDDVAQEGLLGFLSAVHSYKSSKSASFKTYAWTCMRNRIINAVVSKKNNESVFFEDCSSLDAQSDITDFSMSPEKLLESKNEVQSIMQVIARKLSEEEQAVFSLYLNGKTYAEIADTLSMSTKGVDGALQRARKKLKAELAVQ